MSAHIKPFSKGRGLAAQPAWGEAEPTDGPGTLLLMGYPVWRIFKSYRKNKPESVWDARVYSWTRQRRTKASSSERQYAFKKSGRYHAK